MIIMFHLSTACLVNIFLYNILPFTRLGCIMQEEVETSLYFVRNEAMAFDAVQYVHEAKIHCHGSVFGTSFSHTLSMTSTYTLHKTEIHQDEMR